MDEIMDTKVVQMKFDNSQFRAGVQDTIKQLESLENSLELQGASNGLDNVTKASKEVTRSMSAVSNAVQTVQVSFSYLEVAGITAMVRLTNAALSYGKKIANNLWSKTIGQTIEGGKRRSQNIANAKFQLEGLGVAWKDISDDINYGVKDTAYGLDEAAKAAAQMVASMDMSQGYTHDMSEEMKRNLRAISGVAAMTNSSYSEIADVFTTVSSNGRLMTMQLRQLAARGLNVSAILAKKMNETEDEINKMVTRGQISFRQFADIMDQEFGPHAKEANKTFQGALSNMNAALSRLGAKFADPVYENLRRVFIALTHDIDNVNRALQPAVDLFTTIANRVGNIAFSILTNEHFTKGLMNLAADLYSYVRVVVAAINEMLPAGFNVGTAFEGFENFARSLQLWGDKAEYVKDILKDIISFGGIFLHGMKEAFLVFKPLADEVLKGLGLTLDKIKYTPGLIYANRNAIKAIFDEISRLLALNLAKAISLVWRTIKAIDWNAVLKALVLVVNMTARAINLLPSLAGVISKAFALVVVAAYTASKAIERLINYILDAFSYAWNWISGLGIFGSIITVPVRVEVDQESAATAESELENTSTYETSTTYWEDVTEKAAGYTKSVKDAATETKNSTKDIATAYKSMANEVEKSYGQISKAASDNEYDRENAFNTRDPIVAPRSNDEHPAQDMDHHAHDMRDRAIRQHQQQEEQENYEYFSRFFDNGPQQDGGSTIVSKLQAIFADRADEDAEQTESLVAQYYKKIYDKLVPVTDTWAYKFWSLIQTAAPIFIIISALAATASQIIVPLIASIIVFKYIFKLLDGFVSVLSSFGILAKAAYKNAHANELRAFAALLKSMAAPIIAVAVLIGTIVGAAYVIEAFGIEDMARTLINYTKAIFQMVTAITITSAVLTNVTSVFTTIKKVSTTLERATRGGNDAVKRISSTHEILISLSAVLIVLAVDMIAMVGILTYLGKLADEQPHVVGKGFIAMFGIMALLGLMMWAMSALANDFNTFTAQSKSWDVAIFKAAGKTTTGLRQEGTVIYEVILAIAAFMSLMTVCLKILSTIPGPDLMKGVVVFAATFGILAAFMAAIYGSTSGKGSGLFNTLKNLGALQSKKQGEAFNTTLSGVMHSTAIIIAALSLFMLTIVTLMKSLKDFEPSKILAASVLILSAIGSVSIFMLALSVAMNQIPTDPKSDTHAFIPTLASISGIIVSLGGYMLSIAFALSIMDKLDNDAMWNNLKKLEIALVSLVGFIILVPWAMKGLKISDEVSTLSKSMMTIAASIAVLMLAVAATFTALQNVEWDKLEGSQGYLIGAAAFIAAMVIAIGVMAKLAGSSGELMSAMTIVVALSMLVVTLSGLFDVIGSIDWSKVQDGQFIMLGVGLFLMAIITVISVLTAVAPEVMAGVTVVISAMSIMFVSLSGLFVAVGICANLIGNGAYQIAEALQIIFDIEWSRVDKVIMGLKNLVKGLLEVIAIMDMNMLGGALIFSAFCSLTAYSIEKLSNVDPSMVDKVATTIANFFNTLAQKLKGDEEVLNFLTAFASTLPFISFSISAALLELALGGLGLVAFAAEMLIFVAIMQTVGETFYPVFETFVNALSSAGYLIQENVAGLMNGIGQLTLFAVGMIVVGTLLTVGGALMELATLAMYASGIMFATAVAALVNGIVSAGDVLFQNAALLTTAGVMLMGFGIMLAAVGAVILPGALIFLVASGLLAGGALLTNVAAKQFSSAIMVMSNTCLLFIANLRATVQSLYKLTEEASGLGYAFAQLPYNIVQGFVQGMFDCMDGAFDVMRLCGSGVLQAFCDVLGIHSPATEMIWAGIQTVAGFVQGIGDSAPSAEGIMSTLANSVVSIFTDGTVDPMGSAGEDGATSFLDGIQGMIQQYAPGLYDLMGDLGTNSGDAYGTNFANAATVKIAEALNGLGWDEWTKEQRQTFGASATDTNLNASQLAQINAYNAQVNLRELPNRYTPLRTEEVDLGFIDIDSLYKEYGAGGGGVGGGDYTSDLASSISGSSGSGSGINDASKGSAIGTNGSTVTNNNNTYNFVQNNYSPEPLDRSEIYQQTKSQLNSWYNFNLEKNLAR